MSPSRLRDNSGIYNPCLPLCESLPHTCRHDAIRAVALAAMFDNEEVEGGSYSARLLLHDPGSSGSSSRPRDAISDCQVGHRGAGGCRTGWGPHGACMCKACFAGLCCYLPLTPCRLPPTQARHTPCPPHTLHLEPLLALHQHWLIQPAGPHSLTMPPATTHLASPPPHCRWSPSPASRTCWPAWLRS